MTSISTSDIAHLATLSGISLTDQEQESLTGDIEKILNYVDKLGELDLDGVESTYQVTDLVNISSKDEVDQSQVGRDELLSLSPETLDNQKKVPKVL